MSSVEYTLIGRRSRSKLFCGTIILLIFLVIFILGYIFDSFPRQNVYRFDIPESPKRKVSRKKNLRQFGNIQGTNSQRTSKATVKSMSPPKKQSASEPRKVYVVAAKPAQNDLRKQFNTKQRTTTPAFGKSKKAPKSESDLNESVDAIQSDNGSEDDIPSKTRPIPEERSETDEDLIKIAGKVKHPNNLVKPKSKSHVELVASAKRYRVNSDQNPVTALKTKFQSKSSSSLEDKDKKSSVRKGVQEIYSRQVLKNMKGRGETSFKFNELSKPGRGRWNERFKDILDSSVTTSKPVSIKKRKNFYHSFSRTSKPSQPTKQKLRKLMDGIRSKTNATLPKSKSSFGVNERMYYDDKSPISSEPKDKKLLADVFSPKTSGSLKRKSLLDVNTIDKAKGQTFPKDKKRKLRKSKKSRGQYLRRYRNRPHKSRKPKNVTEAAKVLSSKTPPPKTGGQLQNKEKELNLGWLIRDPNETSMEDIENILFKSKNRNPDGDRKTRKRKKLFRTDSDMKDNNAPFSVRRRKVTNPNDDRLGSWRIHNSMDASRRTKAEKGESYEAVRKRERHDRDNKANLKNEDGGKRKNTSKSTDSGKVDIFKNMQQQNRTDERQASNKANGLLILRESSLLKGIQPTDQWDYASIERQFIWEIKHPHVSCKSQRKFGDKNDTWSVCVQGQYAIKKPCLIYSCGRNSHSSFERDLYQKYHCVTRLINATFVRDPQNVNLNLMFHLYRLSNLDVYDPETGVDMITLETFMKRNRESEAVIDLLKLDYGYSVWSILDNVLSRGSLSRVKQLILGIDFHGENGGPTTSADYLRYLAALRGLERAGFRMVFSNVSRHHSTESQAFIRYYELSYVNMHIKG